MRGRRGVAESGAVPAGGRDMNSESFIRPLPSQCSAAPHAGMRLGPVGYAEILFRKSEVVDEGLPQGGDEG